MRPTEIAAGGSAGADSARILSLWTDESLAKLPVKKGFRLRGHAMTRLETFCDAAFAFRSVLQRDQRSLPDEPPSSMPSIACSRTLADIR